MKPSNTLVDKDWQAVQIAKEITIAKLSTATVTTSNKTVGKDIGEMFLAIHEEVKKVFNEDK